MIRCEKCGDEKFERKMHVVDVDCWRCKRSMKIAFGNMFEGGQALSPAEFLELEVDAAKGAGVLLEKRLSKTTGETSLTNVCPHCEVITGNFFMHDYWHLESIETQMLRHDVCLRCEGLESDDE